MRNICVLGGTMIIALLGSVIPTVATTEQAAGNMAPDLTNIQKRAISQTVVGSEQLVPPSFHASIGATVPQSVRLVPLPKSLASEIPSIKQDDVVAVKDQDVLLVRPRDRKVLGVIEDWADASLGG
jgi:hypothetical protein